MSVGNSSFLVEYKDRRILIDAGGTVPYILRDEMGIPLQSITDVILTHLHGDHTSGLEFILQACRWMPDGNTPTVWVCERNQHGFANMFDHLIYLKDGSFDVLLEDLMMRRVAPFEHEVEGPGGLPLCFYPVAHCGAMPCHGITLGPLQVSGDTFRPVLKRSGIELFFHEAEFGFATEVHCPVKELVTEMPPEVKTKTWLYHCPADSPVPEGFAGQLVKGQVFNLEVPE